jgi:hypothetical protein
MNFSPTARIHRAALAGGLSLLVFASAPGQEPADENPVIDLAPLAEAGLNVRFETSTDIPLYVNRKAGRVLDILPAKQVLTVLSMDRYGLEVKGLGKNGPLTGWVGQKKAFEDDEKRLAKLAAFYQRQLEIEKLVTEGSPAVGMNLAELKRILGKPTSHMVSATKTDQAETLVWVIKQKVDLNEALDLPTDSELFKTEVEIGRIEVELVGGLALTVNRNVDGGAAVIPTVPAPIAEPFGPAPDRKVAGP